MNSRRYNKRIEAIKCDNCKNIFMSGNTDGMPMIIDWVWKNLLK